VLELFRRHRLTRQVALELYVVTSDDLFHHRVVQGVLGIGDVGWQGLGVMGAVGLVFKGDVGQHVGHAVQLPCLAEGQLEWNEAAAEACPELIQHPPKVGVFLVFLGDEHQPRHPGGDAASPRSFGTDLHAVDCADHHDGQIGDGKGRVDLA